MKISKALRLAQESLPKGYKIDITVCTKGIYARLKCRGLCVTQVSFNDVSELASVVSTMIACGERGDMPSSKSPSEDVSPYGNTSTKESVATDD